MKIIAWLIIVMLSFLFVIEPWLIGKPRIKKSELYTYKDWLATWVSIGLFVPLCGRVLGWW